MGTYIANTKPEQAEMLRDIGYSSIDDLFAGIPKGVLVKDLNLPAGLSEFEVARKMEAVAAMNVTYPVCFRGAGAYRHYIPAAVKRITSNETFITAYTPYQAELSQGVLQSIFEYQSMICALTGLDVSNASVYDGASAAAEAMNMCRERGKDGVYVSALANPQVIETIKTYCFGYGIPVTMIPAAADGTTDLAAMKGLLSGDKSACGVYIQSPNYYGLVEDVAAAAEAAHSAGVLLVAGVNPISLGLLESPGALGADIACGEGQPLGMPLAWGGPYLGFLACKKAFMRKLPGRIIGETTDGKGERAFVLTLQAREQHIRREKASSNICSNEAHCALTAAVYLSVMGREGFAETARQCHAKAAYAAKALSALPGWKLPYSGDFFHEFVTECPDSGAVLKRLADNGILGGLPLGENRILWCVTELNAKEDIDRMVKLCS
jgi:glycine dehydrogenase subunit 1